MIPNGPQLAFLWRTPAFDHDDEIRERWAAVESRSLAVLKQAQARGVLSASAADWWLLQSFYALIYTAAESVQAAGPPRRPGPGADHVPARHRRVLAARPLAASAGATMSKIRQAAGFASRLYAERARIAWAGYARRDPMARLHLRPGRDDPYAIYDQIRAEHGTLMRTRLGDWATPSHRVCNLVLRDRRFGVQPIEESTAGATTRSCRSWS